VGHDSHWVEEKDAKEIVDKIQKEWNQKPPENMYR